MGLHCETFILTLLLFVSCHSLDFMLNALGPFLNHFSGAVIHLCDEKDAFPLSKSLSNLGLRAAIYVPDKEESLSIILNTEYYKMAVIVDMSCTNTFQLLCKASDEKLFTNLHHWLLLMEMSDNAISVNKNETINILESLDLPINSHVTMAYRKDAVTASLHLQDIYKIGKDKAMTVTSSYTFSIGESWPLPPRRDNYRGISIKTAVIVVEDIWENFFDMRYKHLNTLSKNNYALMAYVARMLNFRMNLTMADQWGYPINGTKNYGGIVGMMQRGEVEIGAAGLLVKETRMDMVEYAGEIVTFRGAFMFLKPSLSEVSVIYVLPFSPTVWFTFMITVIILTLALMFTTQTQSFGQSTTKSTTTWDGIILDSVGIVCNQGASLVPISISSRIIFLSLLLVSVFVTTSYSAIIVSLLQTSSSAINTLSELMDSAFRLSMRNVGYNVNYVNDTNNPIVKRLYNEKLYTQPYKEAFTSQEDGVAKIRTGLYAFHGDAGAYKVMSDVFEEYDKCKLKEIRMYSTNKLAFPVRKGCSYREHITQKARWLDEIGLRDREYRHWFYQKPKCNTGAQEFVSVQAEDFYPVLLVLMIGIICAINIFSFEIIYYKLNK